MNPGPYGNAGGDKPCYCFLAPVDDCPTHGKPSPATAVVVTEDMLAADADLAYASRGCLCEIENQGGRWYYVEGCTYHLTGAPVWEGS